MEIIRKQYLDELIQLIDKPLVKVITGVRKCGKSTLLKQFIHHLKINKNINENNIFF
jgi:predicted AAA+ superfamily ATPase